MRESKQDLSETAIKVQREKLERSNSFAIGAKK